MHVLLISTYELGRQPFGLASPAAWLRRAGCEVSTLDTSREPLDAALVERADLVAIHLPMHTATRLALPVIAGVKTIRPSAHLCCYGLYAPLNETLLRERGVATVLGGEFEADLVAVATALRDGGEPPAPACRAAVPRLDFLVPDRQGMPPLSRYASLVIGPDSRVTVGSTEASRGCRHRCRHCPVVPVYDGRFRIVPTEVVMADVEAQVAAGAGHITFGDPDFFNGIRHALEIVDRLAQRCPGVTYDVTIKVEHLLRHEAHLARLRDTGCLFVTTAVESIDDRVLALLDKGHTRADFERVVDLCRAVGLSLAPTFVPFTPWTTLDGYRELLEAIARLGLVDRVAPIQLAIRLLVPNGSRLLELPEVRAAIGPFELNTLSYPWRHADPRVDELQRDLMDLVGREQHLSRRAMFDAIADRAAPCAAGILRGQPAGPTRAAVPYLNEPWYC